MAKKNKATGTTKRDIQTALKRAEALQYRIAGHTFEEIGEAMGFSRPHAHRLVTDAIAAIQTEGVEQARLLELRRLDMLTVAHMANAAQGDIPAGMMILKIMERRAKLMGLDAVAKTEITGKNAQPIEVRPTREEAYNALHEALVKAGLVPQDGIADESKETIQ